MRKQERKQLTKEERKKLANREIAAKNMERKLADQKDENGKVITKYGKKMSLRKDRAKRERRNAIIARLCVIVVLAVIASALIAAATFKIRERFGTTVTVADEKIDRIEFDYYYNVALNNFMNTYGAYASYFGLDTSKDLSKQTYSENMSWKDYFESGAIDILKRTKALSKEADKNNFEYDVTEDYGMYVDSIKNGSKTENKTEAQYIKDTFGRYATEKNLEAHIKEYLRANAYYEKVTNEITFTNEEQDKYYEEHKDEFDLVDYRSAYVADVDKASEMLNEITDGASFRDLCPKYVTDDEKSNYESNDASLHMAMTKASINQGATVLSWLFDSSRVAGDKAVLAATDGTGQYVVYFENRYITDEQKNQVKDKMVSDSSNEYLNNLVDSVEVKDGTVKQKAN